MANASEDNPNLKEGDKVTFIYNSGGFEYEGTIVPNYTNEENADTSTNSDFLWVRFKNIESFDLSCDIVLKDQYDLNVYKIRKSLLKLKANDSTKDSDSDNSEESEYDLVRKAASYRFTGPKDNSTVRQEPTSGKSEKNTPDEALESKECLEKTTTSHQLSGTGNISCISQEETETSNTETTNTGHSEGLYSEKYASKINQPLEEKLSNKVEPDYEGNHVSSNFHEGANKLSEKSRVDFEIAGREGEMSSNSPCHYNLRSTKSRIDPVEYGEDVARATDSSTRGNCDMDKCDHDSVFQKNSDYIALSSVQAVTYADKAKKGLEKREGDSSLTRMTNGLKSWLNISSSKEACSEPVSGSSQNLQTNVPKMKVDPYQHHQNQAPDREATILNTRFDVYGQRLQKGSLVAIRKTNKKGDLFEELGTVKEFVTGTEVMVCILLESKGGNFSGVYRGITIFECDKNCGVIVPLAHFYENNSKFHILYSGNEANEQIDGYLEFPETNKLASPISLEELKKYRTQRGIQGKKNSCYIDTILFSLFAFCDDFDYILKPNETDCNNNLAGDVKKIITQQIVNPLRTSFFCPSKSVTNLRNAMESLSPKLVHAYMDAEEFVFLLFENCLHLDGFIQYNESSNYIHQIFIDDELNFQPPRFTTTQLLLEMSMCRSDIQFKTIPEPALIIAMPRSDGELKHVDKILPNRRIDVSLLISSAQIKCCVCQSRAFYKCKSCFSLLKDDPGIKSTFFCPACNIAIHAHESRMKHKREKVTNTTEFPKESLNLLAVLCIKSHHYVCFVRCENPDGVEWVFFDSDPASGNPRVVVLEGFEETMITLEKNQNLSPKQMDDLPPMMKRMLSDIYICIYIKPKEDQDL